MKFRTEYPAHPSDTLLDPEKPIALLGSCFTDSVGRRMRECRWRAFPNICGVLYNPASIANIIEAALYGTDMSQIVENSIAEKSGLFVSWLMDSGSSSYSLGETRQRTISRLQNLQQALGQASTLIITFGTAWVYELRECPGLIVSNCHKFPSDKFLRRRLSIEEIVEIWNKTIGRLRAAFPDIRIIFTVSPVRHLKDGFEGNSRSKAILQLACEEICVRNQNAEYFPAYEILNDDLRDYRFYAADLTHPSPEAVEYVWDKFLERYLSAESRKLLAEGESVTRALNHRPIIRDTSETGQKKATFERLISLERYYAFIQDHPSMLSIDE